jgi:hypothetical protein
MSTEPPHNHDDPNTSKGVQIANQIIDFANKQLESGESPEAIASGMRHAAANFSAFAFSGIEKLPKDPNAMVDDFIDFFEHYLGVHRPKDAPTDSLAQLIEQAKNDF